MFGINDDDQTKPADDAPVMPQPVVDGPANDQAAVNPISGNATLGPPHISTGLSPVIPGASSLPDKPDVKKKQLLTSSLPPPSAPPRHDQPATLMSTAPAGADDQQLLSLKKEALQNLSPLVGQLNQPAAEKFKTLMMLLRVSDDPSLVRQAYEAANQIEDPKAKAQALLDVVNEINYFTHPEKPVEKPPL